MTPESIFTRICAINRLIYLRSGNRIIMAAPISKKKIEQLPLEPYDSMREDLQTGDLVFCSGSYFFQGNTEIHPFGLEPCRNDLPGSDTEAGIHS